MVLSLQLEQNNNSKKICIMIFIYYNLFPGIEYSIPEVCYKNEVFPHSQAPVTFSATAFGTLGERYHTVLQLLQ